MPGLIVYAAILKIKYVINYSHVSKIVLLFYAGAKYTFPRTLDNLRNLDIS